MRSKDKTLMAAIEKFVSDYTDSNGISPTMQEVADGVGSSKATVQRYIAQLCDDGILDYSGCRTMTSTKTKAAAIRVPVLGTIACGIPKFAEENIEEYVRLPVALFGKGNFFILRAYGDSMIEAGIDNGDLVLIRQQNYADEGQIVVALMEDEATPKDFIQNPKSIASVCTRRILVWTTSTLIIARFKALRLKCSRIWSERRDGRWNVY